MNFVFVVCLLLFSFVFVVITVLYIFSLSISLTLWMHATLLTFVIIFCRMKIINENHKINKYLQMFSPYGNWSTIDLVIMAVNV